MMDKVLDNAGREHARLTALEEHVDQLLEGTSAQQTLASQLQNVTTKLLKGERTGQIMKEENMVCARNSSNHRFFVEEERSPRNYSTTTCVDDEFVDGRKAAWQRLQIIYAKLTLVSQDVHELVSQTGYLIAETNHVHAETKALINRSGNNGILDNHAK